MKKISVIFGTRPEAIKLAPVIFALRESKGVECHVCVTAQHREMLDQVLDVFQVEPDVDLDLMQANQSLSQLTSRAIVELDGYMQDYQPDAVLVQGDTTTVFCGALAAFYNHIPVGHVEAGLRTGDLYSPWPEEGNRLLTACLAKWHFAPTEKNRENLLKEGVSDSQIFVTGNTGIDALMMTSRRVEVTPPEIPDLPGGSLNSLGDGAVVLLTSHRRENIGGGIDRICEAVADLVRIFPEVKFVFSMHLNPKVRESVLRILGPFRGANLYLIEPQSYLPFVALMRRADLILTDSGGIQEEAPGLGKPVLVLRDTTERPEAITAGTAKIVGTDRERIVAESSKILRAVGAPSIRSIENPYGDGHAAERIVQALASTEK